MGKPSHCWLQIEDACDPPAPGGTWRLVTLEEGFRAKAKGKNIKPMEGDSGEAFALWMLGAATIE
jgi:hypothetical protein